MALDMKKCKECGKLFVPKSKLSQYCDDVHYRPCPVCGKPVEAKYLSDPARCCSRECTQKKKEIDRQKAKAIAAAGSCMQYQPSTAIKVDLSKTDSQSELTMTIIKDRTNSGERGARIVKSLFDLPECKVTVADDIIPMPRPENAIIKLPQKSEDTEHATALRKSYPVRTYVGTPILGFIPGHEYALDIDKDDRNILYIVTAIYDFTEGEDSNLVMNLSSQISINQNFAQL